jgi:hypothetical protein
VRRNRCAGAAYAYPWYITSDPTTGQLLAGAEPLRDLIGLMPRLRVVLVHVTAADKGWKLFLRENLGLIERRGIVWLSTYHTSHQALQTPDRVEGELREASIRNAQLVGERSADGADLPARLSGGVDAGLGPFVVLLG